MDQAQVLGAALTAHKGAIADLVATRRSRLVPPGGSGRLPNRDELRQYADLDLSKLFVAVISHRPAIFAKYVEWQRSTLQHRHVSMATVRDHMALLRTAISDVVGVELAAAADDCFAAADDVLERVLDPEGSFVQPDAPHAATAMAYLAALRADDAARAMAIALDGISGGLEVPDLYRWIVEPVQREVGRLWQLNELTVAQEHRATDTSRTLMDLARSQFTPTRRRSARALTMCPGTEMHDLGARMVNDFLYFAGFDARFIGGNLPTHSIAEEIRRSAPLVLLLSATMTPQVRVILDLIDELRREFGDELRIMVGGYAFNQHADLWRDVGADAFAASADEAVAVVERLLGVEADYDGTEQAKVAGHATDGAGASIAG